MGLVGSLKVGYQLHSLAGIAIMAVVIAVVYLTGENIRFLVEEKRVDDLLATCDLFSGRWVYDNKSYPLYSEKQCPYITDDYACEKFGRKDYKYQYWRWQPYACDLPRINGNAILEKLRNKRVVFVGDSMGRSQWESLLCLIDLWIPDPSQKYSQWEYGSLRCFKAIEYNVSIDFYWEPLLVESNCDNQIKSPPHGKIVKIQSIEKHAKQWIDADVLIFDSFTWWLEPDITLRWELLENSNRTYVKSRSLEVQRYEMALQTWSNWLSLHVNRTKTKLFFMSLSPIHARGKYLGKDTERNCYNETEPNLEEVYMQSGIEIEIEMMQTVETAIRELEIRGLEVKLINITQLSAYRKDGHPSIYKRHWIPPSEQELANPIEYADCIHWCLPGVPDVWNMILQSYLLQY